MKRLSISLLLLFTLNGLSAAADNSAAELFQRLDLNRPGLEAVNDAVNRGDTKAASEALLSYYRQRTSVRHPDINPGDPKAQHRPSEKEKEMALNGMRQHFFVHRGYGYFDFGKDINWQHWPVKDNEIRFQLNRMYWWIPMGKLYHSSGDESVAAEWVRQLRDWIQDNPRGLSKENDRFVWRALETSRRLQDQTNLFNYFLHSRHFSAEFLVEFLDNYQSHAEHLRKNYAERGNHLLFEAQRMVYAGSFFPEFKNAGQWRSEGIDILLREIKSQLLADNVQWELSPNYHVASINIFLKALHMAQLSGVGAEFPQWYHDKVEAMIMANIKSSFADGVFPMFGDAKRLTTERMRGNYQNWSKVFPDNPAIHFFASDGARGKPPEFLSSALSSSGFYSFRNGWGQDATTLIMKAGPSAAYHCQPDNGTFALWYKGVNLMPDSGAYVYSGNAEIMALRNWYRQTRVHQTLTLDNQNIELKAKQLYWGSQGDTDILVYENPSYADLNHRRWVFFVDRKFFVLLDEAIGDGQGAIDLHFQVREGKVALDSDNNRLQSHYDDGKNLVIQSFAAAPLRTIEEQGKVSYDYRQELPRTAVAFQQQKNSDQPVRYVSVVYPFEGSEAPQISAQRTGNRIDIRVDGKDYSVQLPKL